jgi:hypothetical protein
MQNEVSHPYTGSWQGRGSPRLTGRGKEMGPGRDQWGCSPSHAPIVPILPDRAPFLYPLLWVSVTAYEGESVNRSQTDIKLKTYDIWTREKLFLDISSTNIDTSVPSLYQRVETCSIEAFWLLFFQPFQHLRFNLFVISETFATRLWTALRGEHFPPKTGNISLRISFALSPFAHKKKTHNRMLHFGSTHLKHDRYFNY